MNFMLYELTYSLYTNYFGVAAQNKGKIIGTLYKYIAMPVQCFSKLGADWPSTIGSTLSTDNYLIQPHFQKTNYLFNP